MKIIKIFGLLALINLFLIAAEPLGSGEGGTETAPAPDGLEKVGDHAFPTNPMNDRAHGYLLKGKIKNVVSNYGNFVDWEATPNGYWGNYNYLPNVGFLAGVPGQKYSSEFTWTSDPPFAGETTDIQVWGSHDAYQAWTEDGKTNFVGVLFEAENDDGIVGTAVENYTDLVAEHQYVVDEFDEKIYIALAYSDLNSLDPNLSIARIGLIYPWALRPKLDRRTDAYDAFDYGEDLEEWTEDDNYVYYGATTTESWFTRWRPSINTEWMPSTKARENTHNTDVDEGDIFGDTPWVSPSDTYPLLAHSAYSQTWPVRVNPETGEDESFWPGWWAEDFNKELPGCSGLRQDPLCWETVPGRFVSDNDVYMEFDDRWAENGNMVDTNDNYEQTGYPLGLKVMAEAHSYGVSYAEDIMFVTVKVRNESGDWCATDEHGDPVLDEDGMQKCGEAMVLPDGTTLNGGAGFDYKNVYLGFYFDADAVWSTQSGNTGVHTNDDDFMEYYIDSLYVNNEKLLISMAMIYDYDGVSNSATDLGVVGVQLLDTPLATEPVDLNQDGFIDIFPGEPLKMTDWHWFDWYNRPGVSNRETNSGPFAGSPGVPQARNKEEIQYKVMAGDTTNLSVDEKAWFFHTPHPDTDLDNELNPHFDSISGLRETDEFIEDPKGLDCVLIMSCGPFDLSVGEEVPFSFSIIFGDAIYLDNEGTIDYSDIVKNAQFGQIMYNSHYQGFTPPATPTVFATVDHNRVEITWDQVAEISTDVVTGYGDFEGYKLYKSLDGGKTWGQEIVDLDGNHLGWVPLAQFDLSYQQDIEHCIYSGGACDNEEDQRQIDIKGLDPLASWKNLGDDTGIQHSYIDSNVVDGIEYTYSVTAYDMGVEADYTLELIDNDDGTFSLDTLWSTSNPDHWSSPDGYQSIETSMGTTTHDPNFITVTPGYHASNITFPDPQNTDEFLVPVGTTIGNGDRFYTIVNEEDLTDILIKMEIQADPAPNAYEGYKTENPALMIYEIDNLNDQNPVNVETFDMSTLTEEEIVAKMDLPGADSSNAQIFIPDYLMDPYPLAYQDDLDYENNWSEFFDGIRMRFDNGVFDFNNLDDKVAVVKELSSTPDSSLVNRLDISLLYKGPTQFNSRPPYEYKIEFSSGVLDTAYAKVSSSGCATDFKTLLPFKITNLTTGKHVKLVHIDKGICSLSDDGCDYPNILQIPGYKDCTWERNEEMRLAADTVSTASNPEPHADHIFNLKINFQIPEVSAWADNIPYAKDTPVEQEGMLYIASDNIPAGIDPVEWIDDNGDDVNDNPWQIWYPWEDGDSIIIKPARWYVDGDTWVADLSSLGKSHSVTQSELEMVSVVPNPYLAYSDFNETEFERRLRFTHLPQRCKITIFTITGEKVNSFTHDDEYDSNEWWNMRTVNNQEIAPGLYLYTVEADGKKHVGKFAVVR